jgi:hypothetical protein
MNEKAQSKWTGPDEVNGILHVGKGYRPAGMNMADRFRTDREQWYPGDSENGENGIWGDARPGSFDPSRIYRVPVERKDEPGVFGDSQGEAGAPPVVERAAGPCKLTPGYRFAGNVDRNRPDRMEWVLAKYSAEDGWWGEANPGTYHPSKLYQVRIVPPAPPVGEFEDGGRPGGPDWQPGDRDAVEPDMVDHPDHYNAGPIECIDAIRAALTKEEFRGFCKGSTIKYVWRERGKGGDEDLMKGGWYLVAATGEPTAAEAKLLGVIRELHDFAEPTRRSEYADRARQAFRDAAILLGENGF